MTKSSTHRNRLDFNEPGLIPNRPRRSSGFTLVELMITVALAAIILSAAVPSFRTLVQNNRITAQVNEFVTALNLARSEAIKRGETTSVIALAGGGVPNEFGMGWRVCLPREDDDCDGIQDAGEGDDDGDGVFDPRELLRDSAALSGGSRLDSMDNIAGLQYLASGLLNIGAGFTRRFQLRPPECKGDQGRDVTILSTGRATTARVAC